MNFEYIESSQKFRCGSSCRWAVIAMRTAAREMGTAGLAEFYSTLAG